MKSSILRLMAGVAALFGAGHSTKLTTLTLRPPGSVPGSWQSKVRRLMRGSTRFGPPSLRDQILAAATFDDLQRLLDRLDSYNANSRTRRRCKKAARNRLAYLTGAAVSNTIVLCSGDPAEGIVYASMATVIEPAADNSLPTDIQWAPPGKHTIQAKQNGKPVTKTIVVNAKAAQAVQAFFAAAIDAANHNEGDLPFFDFDHADAAASAHPKEFYWGGDDPKTGGIRAKLEWTNAGKAAVLGKDFRRFSPAMKLNDNGEIVGSEINMGGLVNRAAFQKIQPVRAKGTADPDKPTQDQSMKTLLTLLAKAGLISSPDLDEASAASQFQTNHAALQAKQTKAEGDLAAVTAKNTELTNTLKAEKDRYTVLAKAQATAAVNAAVQAKKIEPKNETLIAKYVELYEADPKGTSMLLDSLPANPAFQPVVQAKGAAEPQNHIAAAGATGEHEFVVKAKALAASDRIKEGDAVVLLAKREPKLYEDYRDSLIVYGKR